MHHELETILESVRAHLRATSILRVCQDTGLTQNCLYKLRDGRSGMHLHTLQTLAKYFDANPNPLKPKREFAEV